MIAKLIFILLLPITLLFTSVVAIRRFAYNYGFKKTISFSKPVIVVGNITTGGSGKTPITIAIVKHLQTQGLKVGVVLRGYKGSHKCANLLVDSTINANLAGDEAVLIYNQTAAIVVVNKNRVDATNAAISAGVDVIVSDDGLQHYSMGRDIEIVVIDNMRGVGNGWLLPAGILREPISRLASADILILNNKNNTKFADVLLPYLAQNNTFNASLEIINFVNIKTNEQKTIKQMLSLSQKFYAIAAIAQPDNFFNKLEDLGFSITTKSFSDHYLFSATNFLHMTKYPLLMTAKDAVKCNDFATENMWCLVVNSKLDNDFFQSLDRMIDNYDR